MLQFLRVGVGREKKGRFTRLSTTQVKRGQRSKIQFISLTLWALLVQKNLPPNKQV